MCVDCITSIIPWAEGYPSPTLFPEVRKKATSFLQPYEKTSTQIMRRARQVYQRLWNSRSCPAVMFYREGLSKLTFFMLVSSVAYIYGQQGSFAFQGADIYQSELACGVIIFFLSGLLYELGQLQDSNWAVVDHLNDTWNRLDALTLALVSSFVGGYIGANVVDQQIAISLAAIPLAFAQLQYLSQIRSLGQLIIAILRISTDLLNFLVIYFVCILGFAITFVGLFYHDNSGNYTGLFHALLSLFSTSLNNIDYVFDDDTMLTNSTIKVQPNLRSNYVGLVTYVLFATLSAIILLNLLIAIMSNTFQQVIDKALEEWSFLKVNILTLFNHSSQYFFLTRIAKLVVELMAAVH